jgi:hypothetical protein
MVAEQKRRPGRPPKDEPRADSIRLQIRLTPELRRRLRAQIETDSDMGQFARLAIEQRLARLERNAADV